MGVTVFLAMGAAGDPTTISYTYNSGDRLVGVDYGANQTSSYTYDPAGNLLGSDAPVPSLLPGPGADPAHITLTWPAFPPGFVLETTPRLDGSSPWRTVAATATQTGDNYTIAVALGQTAFYRLRHP